MATRERQNESALVCAARQGDKEALRLLLTCNWAWLRGLVYSIIADADEVDDVLQDICVRVIEKVGSVRQPERFRPWLAVLARRQALRHRQQRARKPSPLGPELAQDECDEKAGQFAEEMERAEQCERILFAARVLPEKYREVFMLQYSSDLTYRQIAEILDIPVTTVQIRLVRARRMIYDQVAGKDESKV
jgi:RNA polymerase sigma factor (sigma-70 family)